MANFQTKKYSFGQRKDEKIHKKSAWARAGWRHNARARNENPDFDQKIQLIFCTFWAENTWKSWYKSNYDFETAIPQNIDGVGRKYISVLGSVAARLRPILKSIFSQLAVNILWNCRLKIVISL